MLEQEQNIVIMDHQPKCNAVGCGILAFETNNGLPLCVAHMPKKDRETIRLTIVVQPKEQIKYEVPRGQRCRVPGCPSKATLVCVQSGLKCCDAHAKPHGFDKHRHSFMKIADWRRRKANANRKSKEESNVQQKKSEG